MHSSYHLAPAPFRAMVSGVLSSPIGRTVKVPPLISKHVLDSAMPFPSGKLESCTLSHAEKELSLHDEQLYEW